jgi:ARG and Rhodanese-Phosphatase-superfamily-associated Protein domain
MPKNQQITESIQLGEPVEHRGVLIAPLFPFHDPAAEYLTLEEAIPLGFRITEVDAAGAVPELLAFNPLDTAVLLYDGEELLGAKQNRILNVTVLAAARSETRIPVSCVEQGRWHARSASFGAARHAAYPDLRRRKAELLSAEPLARGVAQSAVWDEVAAKSGHHGVNSPTGAAADIYREREGGLAGLRHAFPLGPGQSGAVLALGNDRLCLDYVSRPAAFSRLYPKLLEGYLLDALDHLDRKPGSQDGLTAFVARAASAPTRRAASAGLGEDVRLAADRVIGSGLMLDEELLQLSLFTTDGRGRQTRVARPSRRR